VAEDLGIITEDVVALRERLGIPGMAVLQFAFDPRERSAFLPHNHRENLVVYTGTHDNNTTLGFWEEEATPEQKAFFAAYTASHEPVHRAMIRLAMASVAKLAVIPAQDILGLPSSCRLNRPGVAEGNWGFRLLAGELTAEHASFLRTLADLYQRLPG
jgi:4-alpha-glucanotransferase